MPSPTWSKRAEPTVAAAIAAATHHAWMGPEEGASNRFLEALRKMVGPDVLESIEMTALRVFQLQPRAPDGYEVPPNVHLQLCPGCQRLRKTKHTAPQHGRIKLEALRDPNWLAAQFEAGRSVPAVADQLGCAPGNVIWWADKHGVKTPRAQAAFEFDGHVAHRHVAGEAPGAIARALETTVQRVRDSLRRQGLATEKKGHHYFEAEWWRERLADRGMTKLACAREAGIQAHNANYYLDKFGLQHLVDRNRRRTRKYPQLDDAAFLRDLLRRHQDNYESAAREVGCASSYISRKARDVLGRAKKHHNHVPHSDPQWWRARLDRGATTWEMAEEAGILETTARERLRQLGWTAEGYANNAAREKERRSA